MRRNSLLFGFALLAIPFVSVRSQTCSGSPSLTAHSVNLGASLVSGNNQKALGTGLTFAGGKNPLYGGAGVSYVDFDDVDESAVRVGLGGGYEIPTATATSAAICPVFGFMYQSGPKFDFGNENLDLSAWGLSAGLEIGFPVAAGNGLRMIPTGGASIAYVKATADAGGLGSESASETYGILSAGIGFLFNQAISLKPFVQIPVGLEGADASFGLAMSFGVGRR